MNEFREYYVRHLPHYQPKDATLFVTFRLAESLPAHVVERLRQEAQYAERLLAAIEDPGERAQKAYSQHLRIFGLWDAALDDLPDTPTWLAQASIAQIVVEAIHWRDGRVYELVAYCIMPNHVHLVIKPLNNSTGTPYPLSTILHSLKLRTATEANRVLGRAGAFWQHESYDHVARDGAELTRIVDYVIKNPVKARLVARPEDWPYTYCAGRSGSA